MTHTDLPAEMLAMEIREPGEPSVLTPCKRAVPVPADDELLIRVAAAGVNRPDCLQRRGLYPAPRGASDIPGLEVAGSIVAMGAGVDQRHHLGEDGIQPGDRVCALLAGGGYAEYCAVPALQCLPIPENLAGTHPGHIDWAQAAAIPETFFTVWTNLFQRGGLVAGETALIHGGASGIGTTAIQLASAFGARVFATAGTAGKRALCERLGAEKAIDYHEESFAELTRALTDGAGVDVILDIVGASYFEDNLRSLKHDGRLVIIGVLGGRKVAMNLGQLLTKRLTITASTLRARSVAAKGEIARELLHHVWPLLSSGQVAPVIQETMPLTEAARAHEIMEANGTLGKLVLTVDSFKEGH